MSIWYVDYLKLKEEFILSGIRLWYTSDMISSYEIGLYINPYSQKEAQRVIFPLLERKDIHAQYIPAAEKLAELPKKLVVVGGEGTNRMVIQEMYDRGQYRPIAVVGGGTNDVLYHYLLKTGRVMTIAEFLATPADKFPDRFLYRPGLAKDAKGNNVIFNNQIGFGNLDVAVGDVNAAIRRFPPQTRIKGAKGLLAAIPAVIQKGKLIDVYSVARNIRNQDVFPRQDQFGDFVTHAATSGNIFQRVNDLVVIRDSYKQNRIPPENILSVRQGIIFSHDAHTKKVWLDGDTIDNPFKWTIEIGRAEVAIPIFALVP